MSVDHAPPLPALPTTRDAVEHAQRQRQLEAARERYGVTTGAAALPGVPVVHTVPEEQEPSVAWLLHVGKVAAETALNALVAAHAMHQEPDADASGGPLHLHGLPSPADLARVTSLAARLADLERTALDAAHHDLDLPGRLRRDLEDLASLVHRHLKPAEPEHLSAYTALFRTLPVPSIAHTFLEDDTFARLRVAGPNPMVLTRLYRPHPLVDVDDVTYRRASGDSQGLDVAMGEGRLFVADYAELQDLVPAPLEGRTRHVSAPMALFAVPTGGRSLVPVAIRCGRDPATSALQIRPGPGEDRWSWQMAKTAVQIADTCYHALFVHLARTHLVMEAVALATHRELAATHPLHALLRPHLEGTLFINGVAADQLIVAGGPLSRQFGATIASVQSAAANDRLGFDLRRAHVPDELAHRGVDDPHALPDFPYRDDALRVWEALEDWVRDYLALYYDDEAVRTDPEVAAWHLALTRDVRLRGVMPLDGLSDLVDLVTSLLFTGSAQHAAVHFPQRAEMSFPAAFAGAAWGPVDVDEPSEAAWLAMLPPLDLALEHATLLTLLGSVIHRPLGEYRCAGPTDGPWFRDPRVTAPDGPLARFRSALARVGEAICEANTHRTPYTHLLPSRIPASINI